jgi:ribosomal protein S28E/S33
MTTTKLVGTITKFGVRRMVGGDKEKTILFAVHGSVEDLDFLMDKPLQITIEVLSETIGVMK